MTFTTDHLRHGLASLPAVDSYIAGFSGGVDSTCLLHALALAIDPARLRAIHINHSLHEDAADWADHCGDVCARLGVDCEVVIVDARPNPGESPEQAARRARYAAFEQRCESDCALLTAHNQDDQAETLLLQLLRGAGVAGLAAMSAARRFGAGWHCRPLLSFRRAELVAYAQECGLSWIEDPGNRDESLSRNFLRHTVMPTLERHWPAATQTLARSAGLAAEALELVEALAEKDLSTAGGSRTRTLSTRALRKLSPARQRNVLRSWISRMGLPAPSQAHLQRVTKDLLESRSDATPCVSWPGAELRRYRDDIHALSGLAAHDPSQTLAWDGKTELPIEHLGVKLDAHTLSALGVPAALPPGGMFSVRFRRGGERCRPRGRAHHADLKGLFQEAGVPPWLRDRIPLVYRDERLIAVVGYWACD
ncbi:MAG: tRNA lysidine(34) synthetase TilS [Gammaproteobacteria bacterium]